MPSPLNRRIRAFIDRTQNRGYRLLQDHVLGRGNAKPVVRQKNIVRTSVRMRGHQAVLTLRAFVRKRFAVARGFFIAPQLLPKSCETLGNDVTLK